MNGCVTYRGPSRINGEPIMLVLSGLVKPSTNVKTGSMVQTYILADNGKRPYENVFAGTDVSICGDCPHRYAHMGTCYVNTLHGPDAVYRAVARGTYPEIPLKNAASLLTTKMVRLGCYGDPAAVPLSVWRTLLRHASAWTGYTHQWRRPFAKGLSKWCMASVESEADAELAKQRGWRTFRVRSSKSPKMKSEVICPASAEAGKRLTCEKCGACSGGDANKASVTIIGHGSPWKTKRLELMLV